MRKLSVPARAAALLALTSAFTAFPTRAIAQAGGRTSAPSTTTPRDARPASSAAAPASAEAAAVASLRWRSIGPANQAGRVPVIVGVRGDRNTYYVGGAAGGIIKTTNGGITFTPIIDELPNVSPGDLEIAPSDPNILYLGTGEGNPRNSASVGAGVFKSVDAGKTWTFIGLPDTDKIPRIRIDPHDADVVYVCALGHTWGPNEERGLFKTTDGGKTWKKILYKGPDTGCSDIDIDPTNANIVYAGMYTHRRYPWYYTSGGGETGVFKSSDGGQMWHKLTNGLPRGPMDRPGIAVARSDPSIVYIVSETTDEGELWRSDDAGETWRTVNRDPNINFRPFYYSDIRVDPQDPNRIYSLSGSLMMSEDGGRTFTRIANDVHGDHQSMWIDPTDGRYVLSGSDGGWQVSYDRAKNFEVVNTFPFTQFYHVAYDMQRPYNLCGGLQDNGHWCGPSQTLEGQGNRKRDWVTVSGGDGFFAVPDIDRPYLVYSASQGGNITVTDTRTGSTRSIHPYPNKVGSVGDAMESHKYRFNWNSPIVLSPLNPRVVYFGGNVLFKTTDFGQSWEVLGGDLTTNDKSKQKSSGGPIVVDNTAAEFHCTIIVIAPSPLDSNVIWVGTDDGNVQVTRDGGKTWTNVVKNIPGLAPAAWIPTVDASHFDAGTAYVAASHWQDNDYAPYAYVTNDYGKTWRKITGGLPSRGWVHTVREDPKNRNVLYLGTEFGIYASWDGGAHFHDIRNGLPPVPVRDLTVHPRDNDLIIATHGRGLYILDDITPLQKLGEAMATDVYAFDPRPAVRWSIWSNDGNLGQKHWAGRNPPAGATIDYYLKSPAAGGVTITVRDKGGQVIQTMRGQPNRAGVNQAVWNLQYEAGAGGGRGGRGGRGGGGGRGALAAAPPAGPTPETGGEAGAGAQQPTQPRTPAAGAALQTSAAGGTPTPPTPSPSVQGRGGSEGGEEGGGFFGGGGAPYVVPGEYAVTVRAGAKEVTKTVRVEVDPRVQVAEADLVAQRDAGLQLRDLGARVAGLVETTNDVIRQLENIAPQLLRTQARTAGASAESPAAGGGRGGQGQLTELGREVEAVLAKLKTFRDDSLTRPPPSMGYRQYPRLREEVQTLTGSITRPLARPTDPQTLRMRELKEETDALTAMLNAMLTKDIGRVNELLKNSPHIVTQTAVTTM